MLKYKFCVKEKVVCFCLHGDAKSRTLIIVNANEFEGDVGPVAMALYGRHPRLKVLFYDGELTDIEQGFGYTAKAQSLGILINQKTEEVLEQLKSLVLKENDILTFLEKTRRPMTLMKKVKQ